MCVPAEGPHAVAVNAPPTTTIAPATPRRIALFAAATRPALVLEIHFIPLPLCMKLPASNGKGIPRR
jgi:hypothetical protein